MDMAILKRMAALLFSLAMCGETGSDDEDYECHTCGEIWSDEEIDE